MNQFVCKPNVVEGLLKIIIKKKKHYHTYEVTCTIRNSYVS